METETQTEPQTKASTYNEVVKKNIYKWRDNNRDKYNETNKRGFKKYYEKNKEALRAKALAYYHSKKMKKQVENQVQKEESEKLVETI